MCGIAAIVSHQDVNQDLFDALTVLQHRGQDAAGIVTCEGSRLHLRKENGLARDVFTNAQMLKLRGNMGIAHVRYPTAGCTSSAEAQPFYVNSPFGLTLAHNGNLTNTEELKKALFVEDQRHINTDSDSEVLLNVFAHELQSLGKLQLSVDDVFQAVAGVHRRCRGAYAVVIMIAGFGILGFRDPHGIRPIVFGTRNSKEGSEIMMASESVALDVLGFNLVRDIQPGEAVFVEQSGAMHTRQCAESIDHSPCIFEYVYFARPDSIIDRISVYKARLRMGEKLAAKILREWPDHDIDVVIPIPDTSRTSALQLANKLGVKYREGFIKNRYIGRTFIMPGQQMREKSVRQKLNAISLEFEGKNVLLVDDSIVRGTTSAQIIQMARDAGAKKVYFASAAPPVRYPNVYGIDMPAAHELIAHDRTEQEVCEEIGADHIIYQDLEDLIDAVRKGNPDIAHFDTSCFSNQYVTGDIDDAYLARTEALRNDSAQTERNSENFIIEMQNCA
ncbi:MAG: amidophosphoribosyltransferase [Methylococcaceae bacterium]|nr:amidophosphoribosyltransferase [Methylococcaceae bacterium]MDZ4155845.1 amidophosphoribosyltransferase [Methylococcales bacterium]MDP2391806.1 amidophosphoribosyltransferase [Methylococcaceae bacterium]MDP3018955.1 amidophosphoribosyltransferase [Methylococcaceae bacterium]MDP3391516.1 amidophosphoribosyltransferase [Methylococcaceae bacterium]